MIIKFVPSKCRMENPQGVIWAWTIFNKILLLNKKINDRKYWFFLDSRKFNFREIFDNQPFAKINRREIFDNQPFAKINRREMFHNQRFAKISPREMHRRRFAKINRRENLSTRKLIDAKIYPLKVIINFRQNPKNLIFDHEKPENTKTGLFPENPALSVFTPYDALTSCKKSEKTNAAFSRKTDYYYY